ncbi:exodeoxyribonuclease VII small subunit [Rhodobacteraceae bacterium WD3A24]|nr:exodeoxyribonuclease VII small subunit [Rhodobacteraceae bacterium WD3A24]
MNDKPVSEMSFEEAMAALEQVVARLESGDVALEESINLYERGAELKKHCDARLKTAEERVEQIRAAEDGTATGTAPLDAG